jgi:hypothetical protein
LEKVDREREREREYVVVEGAGRKKSTFVLREKRSSGTDT